MDEDGRAVAMPVGPVQVSRPVDLEKTASLHQNSGHGLIESYTLIRHNSANLSSISSSAGQVSRVSRLP